MGPSYVIIYKSHTLQSMVCFLAIVYMLTIVQNVIKTEVSPASAVLYFYNNCTMLHTSSKSVETFEL